MISQQTNEFLCSTARKLRLTVLEMLYQAGSGHPGGCLSAVEIFTALFFNVLKNFIPHTLDARDRFVLSKGHAAPLLYACLAKKGWIAEESLNTLRKLGSPLQGHPDRSRLPIVEAATGSLGQGLSIAQGLALGLKDPVRVFCMIGDGEMQEGQIWEAFLSAAKFRLNRLCVIVDYNKAQIDGWISEVMPLEPLMEKISAFGWDVTSVNGHNFNELIPALEKKTHQPKCIIAHTIKGKGVSFMENQIEWHGVAPTQEQWLLAQSELFSGEI